MILRVTIDIFSGRPNPVIELSGKRASEILKRLRPDKELNRKAMPEPEFRLGYRGLIIEQKQAASRALPPRFRVAAGAIYGPELAHTIVDQEFEMSFAEVVGNDKITSNLLRILQKEIQRLKDFRENFERSRISWPAHSIGKCRCAPLYEPTWWNDGGPKQWNNNCYNYATNYRTDTFAQPGLANSAMYTSLSCASVRPAAVADALINNPGANNRCPREGHLVALVIWPGVDFHWYRKGRNGRWSHKPGGTPVTNLDNSLNLIKDPRAADRGGYTNFCSFMTVMHGHIKLA